MRGSIPRLWDLGLSPRQWLNQLSPPRCPKPSFDGMRVCGQGRILDVFSVQKDGFLKHEDGTRDRRSCPGGGGGDGCALLRWRRREKGSF